MEKFYVKGLGMVENNDENRALLIKLGFLEKPTIKRKKSTKAKVNVIDTKGHSKHVDSDTKRTSDDNASE